MIVDIINNGTDHKRKAILGSNKITAETLVNIIKASRIPLRHSCSSVSKYNGSIRPLGLYNYNPKGQIDKQGKNQGLKEVDEDVFYDLDDNYSVYESCQGGDEVIYRDNETFYEAPDNLDGSPSTGANEGAYGMFGKLFKIIKNFFGY